MDNSRLVDQLPLLHSPLLAKADSGILPVLGQIFFFEKRTGFSAGSVGFTFHLKKPIGRNRGTIDIYGNRAEAPPKKRRSERMDGSEQGFRGSADSVRVNFSC